MLASTSELNTVALLNSLSFPHTEVFNSGSYQTSTRHAVRLCSDEKPCPWIVFYPAKRAAPTCELTLIKVRSAAAGF